MSKRSKLKGGISHRALTARVYRKVVWQWVDGKLVELDYLTQSYPYTGPVTLASGTAALAETHYRFRTDAADVDSAPTWGAAEDTAYWPGYDTNVRTRISIQNTGTGSGTVGAWALLRVGATGALNSITITTTSAFVKAANASSSLEGAFLTTQRLTSGTGSYANGNYSEDGATNLPIANGTFAETELGMQLLSADLGGGETVDIQAGTTTYTPKNPPVRFTTPEVDGSDFQHGVQLGQIGLAVANSASISLTTANAVPSGNQLIVVTVACDNNGTTDSDFSEISGVTIGGVAATKAKEFTNGQGSAQAGATVSMWYLQVTSGLASSSTITATFTTATTSGDACQISARAFTVAAGKTVSVEASATQAVDASTPTSLNATTASIECLRIRATALEITPSVTHGVGLANPKTTNSNWSFFWISGSIAGTSAATMSLLTESRISTGTGDASLTRAFSSDNVSVYVAFKAVAVAKGPPPFSSPRKFFTRRLQ